MRSRLLEFIRTAYNHKGQHGDWVWTNAPQARGHAWCAAFVWTCAKTVGIGKKIIPYTYSARYMGKLLHEKFGGKKFLSPALGGPMNFNPQCGDLIFFRWSQMPNAPWWVANHVGIVVSTTGNTVNTIEGNRNGSGNNFASIVDERHCSKYWDKIAYYVRPAWTDEDYAGVNGVSFGSSSDGTTSSGAQTTTETTPWSASYPAVNNPAWSTIEPNSANDLTIREVGYVNNGLMTASPTPISLSVINYTSGLSKLISSTGVVPAYFTSGEYSTAQLQTVSQAIMQQLVANGFTVSAAVGVLGNIQRESNYQPEALGANGKSGLCMWSGSRLSAMKQFVGSDWRSNVTGQVGYIIHEIRDIATYRNSLYSILTSSSNSESAALSVADKFYKYYFESPYTEAESQIRKQFAHNIWQQISPTAAPVNTKLAEFIDYLNTQVNNHSIYVWGAQGQPNSKITRAWILSRETSETNFNRAVANWQRQVAAGYGPVLRAFDCSGLGMYWLQNLKGILSYDHSANDLYNKCKKIAKDKLQAGDFVFKLNASGRATHIGYIVDNNRTVIEAKGRDAGVIKHGFKDASWNAYGRPPFWTE